MAVKRYDGSAWQVVAGKGDQGTSSSIATWVKTASGGETSMSGNDDSSQPLSYTVGQELVYINGVLQKRGDDYTATTGNSITGLTALTAGDIVSVWTVNAFSVTNAISNTIVDAKGDLLVGTAADTPGRLAVGSNNQVLTADSTTGTGLKWSAPSSYTLISSGSMSGTAVNLTSIPTTYEKLVLLVNNLSMSSSQQIYFQLNNDGTSNIYNSVQLAGDPNGSPQSYTQMERGGYIWVCANINILNTSTTSSLVMEFPNYASGGHKLIRTMANLINASSNAVVVNTTSLYSTTTAITQINMLTLTAATFDNGTYALYGVK